MSAENRKHDKIESISRVPPPDGTTVLLLVEGKEVMGTVIGRLTLSNWYRVRLTDGREVTVSPQ